MFWLILYPDGTFMTWRVQKPRKSDFEKGAKCFEVDPDTSLEEIADWTMYNYPDVAWAKEVKDW